MSDEFITEFEQDDDHRIEPLRIAANVVLPYGPRVIKLIGGPMDGQFHEIESGWPCPSALSFPLVGEDSVWYEVNAASGEAFFTEEGDSNV